MTNDVRNACVALIRNGTTAGDRSDGHSPRPLALGWKLESGVVPARDLHALCAAMSTELGAVDGRRWTTSPELRAFFAEYDRVHGLSGRRGRSRARCGRSRARAGRNDVRPTGSA